MRKIKLTAECIINGRREMPGAIVEIGDKDRGPHRAHRRQPDRIDYGTDPAIDANRNLGEIVDVPLFEEVKEEADAGPSSAGAGSDRRPPWP